MSRSRVHRESLRAARLKAGWTQEQLAQEAKVSRATVAALEAGTRRASEAVLDLLADALGMQVEQLEDVAPEPMIPVAEVAERLAVSPDTVHRLVKAGDLPGYMVGNALRIPAAAVGSYLASRRVAVA